MDGNLNTSKDALLKQEKRGISGSTLKLVAIITMLIDHTGAAIIELIIQNRVKNIDLNNTQTMMNVYKDNALLYNLDYLMRSIGRVAFPIFCFLLVEGMIHTHNKLKYAIRLALFALISEIPFDLAFDGKVLEFRHQNVFFTLMIGLLVMIGFEAIRDILKDKKWLTVLAVVGAITAGYEISTLMKRYIQVINSIIYRNSFEQMTTQTNDAGIVMAVLFSVVLLLIFIVLVKKYSLQTASIKYAQLIVLVAGMELANLLKTDYSAFGVLTIAVMYGLRKKRFASMLGGCVTLTIMSFGEATAFFDLILIQFYNGKRGLNLKYLFYLFYPVHLFLLYLICVFMNIR